MAKKYTKQDEKVIKDLMNTLYDQHKLSGGSFFTDFVHGFTLPLKQFGHLLSLIPEVGPALATVVTPVAEALDKAVPGHRYETISDAFSGKPIKGTGRGRPRKIPKEIKIDVTIEDPTKRDKDFTESAKQLIDEENKNVVGKRPRGRPKKLQGSGDIIHDYFNKMIKQSNARKYAVLNKAVYDDWLPRHNAWLARQPKAEVSVPTSEPTPAPTPAPTTVVGSGKRGRPKKIKGSGVVDLLRLTFDRKKYLLENKAKREKLDADRVAKRVATVVASAPVVGSGKRGRPKGSKNKK